MVFYFLLCIWHDVLLLSHRHLTNESADYIETTLDLNCTVYFLSQLSALLWVVEEQKTTQLIIVFKTLGAICSLSCEWQGH